jgi:hypothetical protein
LTHCRHSNGNDLTFTFLLHGKVVETPRKGEGG